MRIRISISLFFLVFAFLKTNAQTYNYSYTDPCTGNIKNLIVPINGTVTVGYYGFVGNFSQQDFSNGNFESWANNIFSEHAVAIRPGVEEMVHLCNEATDLFESYIESVGLFADPKLVVEAQNYYCEQQSKNERTYNVLKAKLGEERAKYFMDTVLFPKIH